MTRETLRYIIKPGLFQVICCLVGAFVLFGVVFVGSFGRLVLNGVEKSSGVNQQSFTLSYQNEIAQVSNNIIAKWVSIALLVTATIAITTFVLISARKTFLALKTEVITAEDDAKALKARFQSPWKPIIKLLGHLAVVIGMVIFIFISIQILLPLWLALFGTIFTISFQTVVLIAASLAVLGLTINLYCVWTLAQIVVAMR